MPKGLYIHIPFCEKRCAYCDFYSSFLSEELLDEYISSLILQIKEWGGKINRPIDSIYIGGGTPSVLGERIVPLISSIKENFSVTEDAEITAELNPMSSGNFLQYAALAGVNRLSIGVQSGSDEMLALLGRNHTVKQSQDTVKTARKLGFDNISVDLMIALPKSNLQTLSCDIDFILSLDVEHISAYILKIEKNTAFAKKADTLSLPDDDAVAKQYLYMCSQLTANGYEHYEISNFAKPQYQSRHNLKYWQTEEYLGIGPSAHSFLDGKRFYYPNNIKDFIANPSLVYEGEGGTKEEKFLLALRLSKGVDLSKFYGEIPKDKAEKISAMQNAGYLNVNLPHISLTESGMLISNSIITELLW